MIVLRALDGMQAFWHVACPPTLTVHLILAQQPIQADSEMLQQPNASACVSIQLSLHSFRLTAEGGKAPSCRLQALDQHGCKALLHLRSQTVQCNMNSAE